MPRNKNKFKTAVDTVLEEVVPVLVEDASTEPVHSKPSVPLRPRSKSKRKELALAKLQQRQQQQQAVGTGTQGTSAGPITLRDILLQCCTGLGGLRHTNAFGDFG